MKSLSELFVAFSVFALGSSAARAQSIGFSITDNASNPSSGQITVSVVDDATQTPITDAKVSITDSIGFGSVSDRMRVDMDGRAEFHGLSPAPKTVTVTKTGYATLSVVGVEGGQVIAYLRPLTKPQTVVSSGVVNTWDNVGDDSSIAHAGLVFRTVSAFDLLNFQIANFVSPLKDTIDLGGIAGSHDIPSNVVLPKQSVSYLFFSIDLDKPNYRLPIPAGQSVGLTAVEVEAGVDDLVSAAQNKKPDVALLNKIAFKRVGMSQNFSASRDVQVNVDASMALVPTHQVQIAKMPPFKADVIAASFTDSNGDKSALVPSDAKAIYSLVEQSGPNAVTLGSPKTIADAKRAVAAVAVGGLGLQISGVLVSPAPKTVQAGEFLNTPALAQSQPLPANVSVAAPAQGVGAAIFETDQPVWYVYTLPSAGSVSIPTAKLTAGLKITQYSVNQMEFAHFNPNALDGSKILSRLQRFARSSAKLK